MIVAVAIVKGYQLEIRSKIIGFSTHIQVSHLDMNNSFETTPLYRDSMTELLIHQHPQVTHLQPFAIKAGILKTPDEFAGVVLKGVDSVFDWSFINQHILEGHSLELVSDEVSQQILLSQQLASKLKLKVNDPVMLYIAQNPPRVRKFKVVGIYNTGLSDLDEVYAFVDMRQVQKLNSWHPLSISGYEIGVKDYSQLTQTSESLLGILPYNYQMRTIRELYPQLFDWLGLLDLNVWVIISLMVVVACINMITALLILIIERSNMIGILKAMGSTNRTVASVFVYMATYLIVWGMIIGNIAGVALCVSQQYFGWFKLSQDAYYLSEVPILLEWSDIALINAGSFVVCYLMLLLPARFVSRITPVKAIRFE